MEGGERSSEGRVGEWWRCLVSIGGVGWRGGGFVMEVE